MSHGSDSMSVSFRERRLLDSILVAFQSACDQAEIEVAHELLTALEFMAKRHPTLPTGTKLRLQEGLVGAHKRLWHVRCHLHGNENDAAAVVPLGR
jgi:hypothetical protein